MQALPEELRIAVYLADVEGFAYKEIAGIIGTPDWHRDVPPAPGRRQLRGLLANYTAEKGLAGAASAAGPLRPLSSEAAEEGRK